MLKLEQIGYTKTDLPNLTRFEKIDRDFIYRIDFIHTIRMVEIYEADEKDNQWVLLMDTHELDGIQEFINEAGWKLGKEVH